MSETEPPRPDVPVTFIRDNFEPTDRFAIVVLNKRTNSVIQRIATAKTITEPDFQNWLRNQNAQAARFTFR